MTENDMTEMVLEYQRSQTKENGKKLGKAFSVLVENAFSIANMESILGGLNKVNLPRDLQTDDLKKNIIFTCFDRVQSFNREKGQAFSYFCSVVLNQMRKTYRHWRKKLEWEEKYGEFVDVNKPVDDEKLTECVERLTRAYEQGVITQYELFGRLSDMKVTAIPKCQEEYDEWRKNHPSGECRAFSPGGYITFSITA